MKTSVSVSTAAALVILLLCVPQLMLISARHIYHSHQRKIDAGDGHPQGGYRVAKEKEEKGNMYSEMTRGIKKHKLAKEVETMEVAAGSGLPDCSHACGSCSPCRLVMVRFLCASLHEAETCPMAYKCMCHNKSYPVP